jgi:hypothetical protein
MPWRAFRLLREPPSSRSSSSGIRRLGLAPHPCRTPVFAVEMMTSLINPRIPSNPDPPPPRSPAGPGTVHRKWINPSRFADSPSPAS